MVGRIFLPGKTEVVIASAGGVGTTFLLSYVAQHRRTNSPVDWDGLKHSALPPISFNPRCKFVYLHGSPQQAVVSLFRRQLHSYQSVKLQARGPKLISPIPKEMTLEEYADQGVDRFHFRRHFFNWYHRYLSPHPTLFVRYETLFENIRPLLDFLELPKEQLEHFPRKQTRSSLAEGISATTLAQLDEMYGDFARELAELDDVEVRQGGRHWPMAGRYFEVPYLKAYAGQGAFEVKALLEQHAPKTYTMLRNALRPFA